MLRPAVQRRRDERRPDDLAAEVDYHWLLHSLALNPHLPNHTRLRLAEHPDPAIRTALVVGSRDAPRETFARLIDDPDKRVRQQLTESEHVPADLRARLVRDPDPEVRASLAQWWPQAPDKVRRTLLTDPGRPGPGSRLRHVLPTATSPGPAGRSDSWPARRSGDSGGSGEAFASHRRDGLRLSNNPDDEVRQQVAQHPQLPPNLRDRLGEDASASVRVAIFARPDTPKPLRRRIYSEIQQATAPLTDLLDSDLDDAAFLRKVEDSIAVTELRNLNLTWVTADPMPYVSSPYVCFRSSAARSRSLPAEAVTRLLNDDESIVRTTMARHAPHLVDLATAVRIDRDFRPDKKTNWRPADDFTFPPQTLRRFATDPDPRMRCLAPRDPELLPELAAQMAADPESSVRRAVATHPRLPIPALITLLADQSEWVARAAASSPSLPVTDMERLLTLARL
ncbi:hypothetical protein [Micromonospora echinaurantiaca]|uniref:hypothetical protein n=1 Tax=Micromonospora echinaurantiaca TaxID=47857 RepID=UPI00379F2EAE